MKKNYFLLAFCFLSILLGTNKNIYAQLPDGNIAPNWTLKDINGTNYTLYDYLAQGKKVVIDFSAVWCNPCWVYHTSGALDGVYNQYGPTGTVDQSMMVFFIEADGNSLGCLQGVNSGCTGTPQGNWTTGTVFPMFLTCAAPTGNGTTVNTNYSIAYFPTVYTVCPDHTIYESGQLTTAQHYAFANSHCAPLSTTVNDVKAFSCTVPNIIYCVGNVTPGFTIQNYGTVNLTSCTVTVKVDGNTVQTLPWTGSIGMYETASVTLNQITGLTDGTHTLNIQVDSPNGVTDENTANNSIDKTLNIMLTPNSIPITQDFSSSTFPPAEYDIVDVTSDGYNWARSSTAGHTATGSMFIEDYSITTGNTDDFKFPLLDFTGILNPTLTFWVAHRRYSTSYTDKLELDVSSNCGTSWAQKWMKSGATLATNTTVLTTEYLSPVASDWRQETVDLSAYQNMSNIMVRFRSTSGYGNNVFVDDVNIAQATGIHSSDLSKQILLYPNPASTEINIANAENSSIQIIDLMGKVIISKNIVNNNEAISTSQLTNGTYFVRITTKNETVTRKIIVNR